MGEQSPTNVVGEDKAPITTLAVGEEHCVTLLVGEQVEPTAELKAAMANMEGQEVTGAVGESITELNPAASARGTAAAFTTEAVGEEDPPITTKAIGEEDPPVTTLAVGEEGPVYTTLAIGEEDPPVTTLAVGEETTSMTSTARGTGDAGMTTLRVGEEDPPVTTAAIGEEGPITTLAVGEETGPVTRGGGPFGAF